MAVRLATSFKNISNITYVIEIHDSTWGGAQTKYIAGGDGFTISYEGEDRLSAPILSSQVSLPIYIQDDNRTAITNFITDLATNGDENRFTVVIYADTALFWRGKIQAERISIPDQYTALISISANDGFGRLRSIPYDNAGTLYTGLEEVTGHIFKILSKLDLFSYGGITTSFATITNWTYNAETWRMLENVRFHHDAVKEIKSDGTILPLSCYDVLENILNRFQLRIVQQGGVFYIQNVTYLAASGSKSVNTYDNSGVIISTISADFNTTLVKKLAGGQSSYREPCKSVTAQYSYKDAIGGNNLLPNILELETEQSIGDIPSGNGEVFNVSMEYLVKHTGNPASIQIYYIENIFRIRSGSYYLTNESGNMEWVLDNTARVRIIGQQEIEDAYTYQILDQIAFISSELPASGEVFIWWTFRRVNNVGTPVTPLGFDMVTPTNTQVILIYALGEANEGTIVTTATGGNTSGEEIGFNTFVLGDGPFLRSVGRLQYYDTTEAEWLNTADQWGVASDEGLWIDELQTREVLSIQRTATRINSMTIRQSFPGCANKINNEIVLRAELNANAGQWRIESFVPVIDRTSIVFTDYVDSEQVGGLPDGITPTPPVPIPNYWKRTVTELSPATAGDNVRVEVESGNAIYGYSDESAAIMGESSDGAGIIGSSENNTGVAGSSSNSYGGVFQSTSKAGLLASRNNADNNAIQSVLDSYIEPGVGGSNDIGVSHNFYMPDSASSTPDLQGLLAILLSNATSGSETSDFVIKLRNAGAALAEKLRLTGAGQLQVPQARIGTSTDNITIDKTGHMTFNGAATVWDDVRVPANNLTTAGSNDPSKVKWKGNLITWAFDQSKMNQLFFEVQIPHGYKEGSDIYPHIHWRPLASAASATRVRWGLEYVWQNVGEEAPTNTTTIYTTEVMPSENLIGYKHYLSAFDAITGKGKKISSCLSCRIFRDAANAADDFAGDAGLIEIDFHIEMDTIGSNKEYVK